MNGRWLVDQYLTCEIAWILQNHCRRVTWGRRQGRLFGLSAQDGCAVEMNDAALQDNRANKKSA